MRLGQLARKLSVRPSQIVDLLAKDQQFLEDGSNAKLSDDLVIQIVLHFAPDRLTEIMLVQTQEAEPELPQQPETVINEVEEQQPEIVSEIKSEGEETETIRAPKVELAGLKVLGKIELPGPRKKEEPKGEGETTEAEQKPKREHKNKRRKPIERTEKPWRNPIALQREKEEREKEERKKQLLEEQKERKRLNYLNKIKNNTPVKAVRIYDEPVEKEITSQPTAKPPRTWLGKFLRWLNT
ncbi:MAG TPA: hypothetical protein PKH83_09020 [Cyclobacteriaceae bacterium]|nr:hypothetical protein [Cyclobacteriaceae bacterium]HNU42623.1 hypothetical protein [Cyclobacteriaceae bacterium]